MGLNPSATPTAGSGWCRATLPPSSRALRLEPCGVTRLAPAGAEAPSDTSCSTSRGLTGQGPASSRRPAPPVWLRARARRASCWACSKARPVTGASPQPDPLGHLMSRDRGAPDGESDAERPPSRQAGAARLRRSRHANPAPSRERESAGPTRPRKATRFRAVRRGRGRGPLHPNLREEARDRLHPRCLPSMSHPGFGYRAFALHRPSGGALSTGCRQPVENARRRFALHAPTRLP